MPRNRETGQIAPSPRRGRAAVTPHTGGARQKTKATREVHRAPEGWSVRETDTRGRTRIKSTWELLLPIWDLEERPEAMLHEPTVNAMTLDSTFAYKAHFELQNKKEGKGEATFGKDKRLPEKVFPSESDNCDDILHSVRFERGPVAESDRYWAHPFGARRGGGNSE